jgi:carbon-monoxide dehydrogenase medium subunit
LLVYGAVVNLVNATGPRSLPLAQFFKGPGRTAMERGELVESIDLPFAKENERQGAAFARATRRLGVDLATINIACLVKASGQTLFAYGAVAPTPLLVSDDSGKLADANCREDEKLSILENLIAHTAPISDVRASHEYREALLMVMSRRVLDAAIARLHDQEALL